MCLLFFPLSKIFGLLADMYKIHDKNVGMLERYLVIYSHYFCDAGPPLSVLFVIHITTTI